MIDDVQQVRLAALVGAAVALDQPAAEGELVAEDPILRRAAHDGVEPALDQRLLGREADAAAAQPAQAGENAQRGESGHAVGADLERPCERRATARLPAPIPAGQRLGQPPRQQGRHFGHARLEVVVHPQQLAVADLDLATDPLAPRGPALEVGDPHDVVERHPEREVACRLAGDRTAARAGRVARPLGLGDACQPLDVELGIGRILVLVHAGTAERQQVMRTRRKARGEVRRQGRQRRATQGRCEGSEGAPSATTRCTNSTRARASATMACARSKPRRLASAPLPPARITASHGARPNGSDPLAASAPNITALTTVPASRVTASMSKTWCSRL